MKKMLGLGSVRLITTIGSLVVGLFLGAFTMSFSQGKPDKVFVRMPFLAFYGPAMSPEQFVEKLCTSRVPPRITQGALVDVNRKWGTRFTLTQVRKDKRLQKWVAVQYLNIYATEKRLGHYPRPEDMARILKGGPSGAKSHTLAQYWNLIQRISFFPQLPHPIG
ncbi:MAG: hypothetical protein AAB587_00800 [Patescibacteria group bacterium]